MEWSGQTKLLREIIANQNAAKLQAAENQTALLNALKQLEQATLQELRKIETLVAQLRAATGISILFSKSKGENMPLTLPLGDSDEFYIYGTAPTLGALLGPGQTISVVSADPNTVVLTPDATPKPVAAADATAAVPAGTPTILSGVVSASVSPAQPNVAIICTATVLNSDGSTAETLTDTVTVSPQAASAIGVLFGAPTPVTSSSAKPK